MIQRPDSRGLQGCQMRDLRRVADGHEGNKFEVEVRARQLTALLNAGDGR